MDASRRRDVSSDQNDARDRSQIRGEVKLKIARDHPITDLGGDDPASVWEKLSPMQGANQFVGPKVAPGIQVVLQSDDEKTDDGLGRIRQRSRRVHRLRFDLPMVAKRTK